MKVKTDLFVSSAEKELKNQRSRDFLRVFSPAFSALREDALESMGDSAAAQSYGAAIRAESLTRLPELLQEFENNATANGAKIVWARDAEEANQFVLQLARERNVRYLTKGKSMLTEEMGLNEVLEQNGIDVFETDLGEFIAQQLKRPPFHIVGPAINVPVEEICQLFLDKGIIDKETLDPVELGLAARIYLRDKLHHLTMGVTGVNMAVAATGTIINVENEGNIRFNKSSPRTQVSIMSLEKVVPDMEDALYMLRLLCRNCTGQKLSVYVSMDSGPKKSEEIDGPEELFIIIVDNGRTGIYNNLQTRQVLRCIRCGACLNICPIYSKIGGYPYGWAYSGPMGQILNPLLLGLEKTQDLYKACTFCGACKAVCPAGIDHPALLRSYRNKDNSAHDNFGSNRRPWQESTFFAIWSRAATNVRIWNLGIRLIRPVLSLSRKNRTFRKMIRPINNWLLVRDMPLIPAQTFRQRWVSLKKYKR